MENSEPAGQSSTSKSGTQKFILPLIIVAILLIAGAGGYMVFGKNLMKQQTPVSNENTAVAAPSPTAGSVISSIQEALAGSQSLQCDFTDENGRKTTSYMKSGMIRTDFQAADPKQSGSMIMKDKKMYFWNGKAGTMMSFDITSMMERITEAPKTTPVVASGQKPEDFVDSLERYKQSCKPATVADALFTPPSDVKFTDLSSMMKAGSQTVPSGAVPSAMTEEQIKALQEQYQQ